MLKFNNKKANLNLRKKKLNLKIKKLRFLKTIFAKKVYILNINITLNNIYVSVTTSTGSIIFLGSGGSLKLKNSKRNTTYVMQLLLIALLRQIQKKKIKFIILKINNLTKKYRKLVLKYLYQYNIKLLCIQNLFNLSYNGVRLKKNRRV